MKTKMTKMGLAVILALGLMSFSALKTVDIKIDESVVKWKGYKVTGEHEGTITLKSGALDFNGEALTGGMFVMDMTSINTTDLDGEAKGKLDGHLKSADFFGVENHPTASFKITKASGNGGKYNVTGDLTIKGITHPVSFEMTVNKAGAVANLKVDRTKYDIKYGSASFFDNLKDRAIYDEFDLMVNLKF